MGRETHVGSLGVGLRVVALALVASCSSGTRDTDRTDAADASVSVAIDADGDARVRLWLERFDPSTSPVAIGNVARVAFPQALSIRVDPVLGSSQQVQADVEDALGHDGVIDAFAFDGGAVVATLASSGYRVVDLEVCWPRVPSTVTSSVQLDTLDHCLRWWGIDAEMSVPSFTVRFEPEPWRWWALVAFGLAGGALALEAVREHRRPSRESRALGLAFGAFVVSSAALVVGGVGGAQVQLELTGLDGALQVITRRISWITVAVTCVSLGVALIVGTLALRRRPNP